MTQYKAIIIDDEDLARDLVRNYLSTFDNIEIIGEFGDGFTGLKGINELNPDIVFLDIQMPKLTGLELLELLDNIPHIIFTTAYDQYAIRAFEHNAIDYLLKPFSKDRFAKAVEKVFQQSDKEAFTENIEQLKTHVSEGKTLDKIAVKSNNEIHVLAPNEVIFIESEDDYVMIHTASKKFLKHRTMKYYEEHLDKSDFVRIHRSYIVNINAIKKIEKYGKDSYHVELNTHQKLKISRSRYQNLKSLLNI